MWLPVGIHKLDLANLAPYIEVERKMHTAQQRSQNESDSSGVKPPSRPDGASGSTDRVTIRISAPARSAIDEIKKNMGYKTDADVIRYALGTQRRIAESIAKQERIFIGTDEGELLRELSFPFP